ncbi:MAG: MATE family efflux transporter [Deltaproteobacteria bacterium]|nr:MATE family efflux transporter [Deltaproteobacteria bacterium]
MTSSRNPFGLQALLHLAWPVVVARSSQAVIGFSDALMTAPLGEVGLAAVTTGAMNTFMITILPMGVVFIGQSFAAQLSARGRPRTTVRYAWYALIVAGVAALASLAAIPAVSSILGLLGYQPDVHRLMTLYLQIRLLSIGAAVATEALGNWYGGLGNTRLHMVAGVIAMLINVFLNWVLIFGHLGFPALGVEGAAWASVIATGIGFLVLLAAFGLKIAVPTDSVRPAGLSLAELRRFLRFGLPHGVNWFLEFTAFAFFINIVVAGLGTVVLAAMMVVIQLNSVSFMPAFGLTSAGAILTGQAIGEGKLDEVGRIVRRTLAVTLCWQGSVGLAYLLLPAPLMRLFQTPTENSAELVAIGATLLAISALWQLFDAAALTLGEALRSAGDTAWVLWARVVIAWVIFTPSAYFAVRMMEGGHIAAMLCVAGYIALLAVVLVFRFRSGAWKEIDLTGADPVLVDER